MQYILCNLPKVFQKVRTWQQILISQQNSIFGGLKFLCEFKLLGEGPSGFRTTSEHQKLVIVMHLNTTTPAGDNIDSTVFHQSLDAMSSYTACRHR